MTREEKIEILQKVFQAMGPQIDKNTLQKFLVALSLLSDTGMELKNFLSKLP